MRHSKWDCTLRGRVYSGKTPGRRQSELYRDICEAIWGVKVDHRLPWPRLGAEKDGVPGDKPIIGKRPLGVHVRIPVDEPAVRRRIAYLGVHELVEAGNLLSE